MSTLLLALRDADQARAWRAELDADGRFDTLPLAHSFAEVRLALIRHRPTLLVSDLSLFDGRLADFVRVLRNGGRHQVLPVLAVAQAEDDTELLEALQAGADSLFIARGAARGALPAHAADTLAGGADIAPWIARRLLDHFGPGVPVRPARAAAVEEMANPLALTGRERQLLRQLSAGLMLNDVAAVEGVMPRDLTALVRAIYRKMQWALRAGSLQLAS